MQSAQSLFRRASYNGNTLASQARAVGSIPIARSKFRAQQVDLFMFYQDLFAAFTRHNVDYVLIGGLAVSLHGIERATMDIDVTVAMTTDNLSALVAMARELGMTPVLPINLETLTDLEQLATWHHERNLQAFALHAPGLTGITLDVLLYPPVNYTGMRERAVTFKAGDVSIVVVSIEDLIALKQAVGRPIDLADIEHLKRLGEV